MPTNDEFSDVRASVAKEYPVIGQHLQNFAISWGAPEEAAGRGLEYYPLWDTTENPTPGKPHLQLFDRSLSSQSLNDAVAGDALHYLGANNPETGKPVDPEFRSWRDAFSKTYTPEQTQMDRRVYQEELKRLGEDTGTFENWRERSRTDAYIRGHLFPDANNEWKGIYTPTQTGILEQMRAYLKGKH